MLWLIRYLTSHYSSSFLYVIEFNTINWSDYVKTSLKHFLKESTRNIFMLCYTYSFSFLILNLSFSLVLVMLVNLNCTESGFHLMTMFSKYQFNLIINESVVTITKIIFFSFSFYFLSIFNKRWFTHNSNLILSNQARKIYLIKTYSPKRE